MIGYQDNSWLYIASKPFFEKLAKHYTLQNLKRVKMLAMNQEWQARNEPINYQHWWQQGDQVKIPLGLLGSTYCDLIERNQKHTKTTGFTFTPTLTPEQKSSLEKMMKRPVGIMNAGTGTGKSYMILWLTAHLKRKTLILVHSTVTLKEMVTKCQEFLGVTPIVVGGSKKYKSTTSEVTICLIHSADKLNMYEYGAILADECDLTVSTDIRQKLWYACSPDYLYGFSATLKVNMQEESLIKIFFGMPESSLLSANLAPKIKVIPTRYVYDGPLEKNEHFSKMMSHNAEDVARNTLIINYVASSLPQTETKKALILVKRTEQAKVFQEGLKEKGITSYIIVGETPEEERKAIRDKVLASAESIVIIGSAQILGRGFDLPPLQAVYITYPNKFDEALIQVVGRVLREYEWKTYGIVYDFADIFVSMLRRQLDQRRRTYKRKYWVVVK